MTWFTIANPSIYWSAEVINNTFTGNFKYNYHGKPPLIGRKAKDINKLLERIQYHLNHEYRFLGYSEQFISPSRTKELFNAARENRLNFDNFIRQNRIMHTPPAMPSEAISKPGRVSFEGLDTDMEGNIVHYNPAYQKPELKPAIVSTPTVRKPRGENIYVRFVTRRDIFSWGSEELKAKVKRFYDAIPRNMVYKKRPFTDARNGMWGPNTGRNFFILHRGEVVAAFEYNFHDYYSDFFYIKTSERYYNRVLKRILQYLSSYDNRIVIKFKGDVLKQAFSDVLSAWNIRQTIRRLPGNASEIRFQTANIPAYERPVSSRREPSIPKLIPNRWEDEA